MTHSRRTSARLHNPAPCSPPPLRHRNPAPLPTPFPPAQPHHPAVRRLAAGRHRQLPHLPVHGPRARHCWHHRLLRQEGQGQGGRHRWRGGRRCHCPHPHRRHPRRRHCLRLSGAAGAGSACCTCLHGQTWAHGPGCRGRRSHGRGAACPPSWRIAARTGSTFVHHTTQPLFV